MLAIKRLTTNDISWFSPKSKSHQSGINLPLKSFKEMFQDVYNDASSNAPRLDITANWFASDGTLIDTSKSQVIKYHSKNELRLVTVPIQSVSHYVDLGSHMLVRRSGSTIDITIFSEDCEHLIRQLGHEVLLQKLPPKST
ncbi:MAG: hypothetical protein ACPH87_08030 [Candidatus Poseidoniaceae archaeon]